MIERLIRASASRPALTIILALAATVLGATSLQHLRRDVFPDLSAPVFNVIVQNVAMGAEELETGIAIPLEAALAGLPDIRRIRSVSQLGVCQVTVEFEPDADYYRARQFVAERVNQIGPQLPAGTEPPLVSGVTGRLNEIFEFTLEADPGKADLMTLRDLAEFDVKNRLLAVPGVAAVERLGGYLRQFQVQLDPQRMGARRVSLDDVMHAVETANVNASGGFVRQGPMEWSVRALGRAAGVEELRQTVVVMRGTTPVLIGDVADVRESPATRRGMAHRLKGEVVSARIVKQFGSDTVTVAAGIRQAVAEIRRGLPEGVVLRTVYDQSALVQAALGGVGRAVLLGAAFVVIVLFALLGDVRAAIIVTLTIPMSIALAGILLDRLAVGLNTMTLGGLAIAVGLLVDAAIIVTENIVHRLRAQGSEPGAGRPGGPAPERDPPAAAPGLPAPAWHSQPPARREIAIRAAAEMGRPIAFATLIVIAVFLPLFGMSGIEGRMYQPLAAAVMAAVAASLILALSVVPVVGSLVLRAPPVGADEDVWIIRRLKIVYAPVLDFCLRRRWLVLGIAAAITVPAIVAAARVGSDFMPKLDEGALLLQTILPPDASLEEVDRLNHRVEDLLREIPEVDDVVRRTGRAEATEDPMPHTTSDVLVVLKKEGSRSLDEVEDAMRARLKDVPGVSVLFTTPLGMRIDEGLGGTPADIAVRIFGPDLDELARLAERARFLMSGVAGVSDLRAEPLTGLPQLRIIVDRAATARVGLSPGDVIRALRILLVGEKTGEIWVGQRRFDLVVRLPDESRSDINAIRSLFIDSHERTRVPLGQLATVAQAFGPGAIRREAGSRRVAVEASATGRDLGGVARDIQLTLARDLQLPSGYFFDVAGRVESQARASQSLMTATWLALVAVVLLLYVALDSFTDAAVILVTIPVALVGGIVALLIAGETWNVSSLVGLIGLFGIAVQNSLVLVTQTRGLCEAGLPLSDAVREASLGRVRPKLMTAATAILGLLPFLLLRLHGTEIERPLAIVMIGGLVTSTLFTLLVLPALYLMVGGAPRPGVNARA